MANLQLGIAVGDYDRMRPLVDGAVAIDGVDPQFMLLDPEEIFFRAFRHADFDVCELSLSSTSVKIAAGDCPYIGIPVFPSRAFRHSSIYVRTDRIKSPADLRGKRVGVPEYQLTANVWVRLIIEEDHGIRPAEVTWVRGGYEHPGRVEKIGVTLPAEVRVETVADGATLSSELESGALDAVIGPRAPSCFDRGAPHVGYLFPDPQAAATEWYRRTRMFPIMHLLGLRRTLAERHPWLPAALLKAFEQSKALALAKLTDTAATKVTLPFVEDQLRAARTLMGADFWSYGFAPNRDVLERFLRRHHQEGLSSRLLAAEELFHPATLESHKI